MTALDPRTPVLVGVGTVHQSVDEPGGGAEALDLMLAAVRAAADDAGGGPGLLAGVGRVAVPNGAWSYADPGRFLAEAIGASGARTTLADVGVPQQTLVSAAIEAIRDGEVDAALVVGGEAKRRAQLAERAGVALADTDQGGVQPDERLSPEGMIVHLAEIQHHLVLPVQQYALIESALRAAEGRTVDEHLDDVARLWAGFNRVAGANPEAAFPEPKDEGFLRAPGPDNRLLAFPYARWHSTQWGVDQAAALLLCSVEAAQDHGIPEDRWVFPLVALESSHALPLSARRELHRWPAMRVLGEAAARHLGRPLSSVEHAELYSCFPSAVRVQQRELGLPVDGVPTLTGGMAFAGGPFNSFTYQATATMVRRLRDEPGTLGLLTTVSGLLTKPGLVVWSAQPPERPVLVADLAAEAEAATDAVEVVDHAGPATIAAVTVAPDDRVAVIADTPDGRRCVATVHDGDLARRAVTEETVGLPIEVSDGRFRPAATTGDRT